MIRHQRDPRAQASQRLGQLAPHRSRSHHRQPGGKRLERKDRLVGQGLRRGQAGEIGNVRAAPRRNHGTVEGESHLRAGPRLRINHQLAGRKEPPPAQKDIDPQALVATGGIVRGDAGPQGAQPLHDAGEVGHGRTGQIDPHVGRPPHRGDSPGRSQQRLRRDTPDIQTVAPQQTTLDQGHAGSQPGGPDGADQPGGPASQHHQVVLAGRNRILPVGWGHPLGQPAVLGSVGQQRRMHGSTLDKKGNDGRRRA